MNRNTKYFLVESGPIFDLCQKWCEEYFAAIQRARDFADRHNMESFRYDIQKGWLTGGIAKRGVEYPEWTKPRASDRLCHPKKKTDTYAEWKAQVGAPSFQAMLEEITGKIPSSVSYEYSDGKCRGSSMVGGFFSPGCYTFNGTNGPFLIDIPDVHGYFEDMKPHYADAKWTNCPGEPVTLMGCREIHIKEWEILKLQHELASEQKKAPK